MYVCIFFFCVVPVQMRQSLTNKEINSYYKDFPVFEYLTELQLSWSFRGIHDLNRGSENATDCPNFKLLTL